MHSSPHWVTHSVASPLLQMLCWCQIPWAIIKLLPWASNNILGSTTTKGLEDSGNSLARWTQDQDQTWTTSDATTVQTTAVAGIKHLAVSLRLGTEFNIEVNDHLDNAVFNHSVPTSPLGQGSSYVFMSPHSMLDFRGQW